MKKLFGFGSSTPRPPALPTKPPAAPSGPPSKPAAPASPSIVGRWKEPKGHDTTEFRADGTVTEKPSDGEHIHGRYSLDGSKLKIRLHDVQEEIVFSATIKPDSLELTSPDGQTTRYEKA